MAIQGIGNLIETVGGSLNAIKRMHQAGVIDLARPDQVVAMARANGSFGPQAALIMKAARDHPDDPALADERGEMTFRELDEQSNALADSLLRSKADGGAGLSEGDVLAVLARDHRGLLLAISAAGRAGLRLLMMNTGFAAPQLAEVAARENVRAVLYDQEFTDTLRDLPPELPCYLSWVEAGEAPPAGAQTIDDLIARGDRKQRPPPGIVGGFIILTSGTTGLPKGAPRTKMSPLASALFVDRIPFPRGGSMVIVSPLFHATGFGMWAVGSILGNKAVLLRRFDAEATVAALAKHRAEMLVAVPTMLQRMVALGPEVLAKYDLSALRVIAIAGSALSPDLAAKVQDTFGEVLYNVYGSTEVAIASVAQPHELRAAPGTVGRAPVSTKIGLFDEQDRLIEGLGRRGRVFVRSGAGFEGYTDGRHKQIIDGYMSTGDIGHFDADGLLFIEGRDDDMIVSGGENLYPLEVENLLAALPSVDDVAVIGVPDADFGTRLRAIVVVADGTAPDAEAIRGHVRANLANYKVPREVVFVAALPRNPTGKVVRRLLAGLTDQSAADSQ